MQMNVKTKLAEILSPIEPYMQRVDVEIREKMKTGISLIDEGAFHLFKQGGKKIRAALIILCSGLKNNVPDDVIEVAASAEIVHAATLIHDDIIDESTMRRGELTVSKKYGNRVAVLVGDYLYTRALEVAVGSDRLDLFPIMVAATRDMVKGELYQIEYSSIKKITKEHYFRIIEMKTARFMAACAKLGGVKSRMSDEESDRLYQFGLNLGFAFQIVDDTLDVVDTAGLSGKDSGNDFLNGKITLPFLHLLETSGEAERKELEAYALAPDERNWGIVRERIISSGAVEHCIDLSGGYVRDALKYLDFFQPSRYKDIILNMANFLLERNF
jgi:octaprenyl-diphosphate synthase